MTDAQAGTGATMDVLSGEECYRFLRAQEVGRLGVDAEQFPLVIPVDFGVAGSNLVIRVHPGPVLEAALHTPVAFEIDRRTRSGW